MRPGSGPLVGLLLLAGSLEAGAPDAPYAATPGPLVPFRGFVEPTARFFPAGALALPGEAAPRRLDGRPPGSEPEIAPPGAPPDGPPDPVRVGLMLPGSTAPWSYLGREMENGVRMAVDAWNLEVAAGAPRIELVVEEAAPVWGASSNAMVRLAHHHQVSAVIGAVDPSASHIALRVSLRAEVPIVNTATTDPTLTETMIPWLLHCCVDDRQYGFALTRLTLESWGLRRVALVRVNQMYGRKGVPELVDAFRRMGRPLVLEMRFEPGTTDFALQIETLGRARIDGLIVFGDAADSGRFVKQARQAGLGVPIAGGSRLVDPAFLEAAGPAADGVILVTEFDPTSPAPGVAEFVARYRERFGALPGAVAARSYDGAWILARTIGRVGGGRRDIMTGLLGLEGRTVEGVGGPMTFDSTLANLGPVQFVRVAGGSFRFVGSGPPPKP